MRELTHLVRKQAFRDAFELYKRHEHELRHCGNTSMGDAPGEVEPPVPLDPSSVPQPSRTAFDALWDLVIQSAPGNVTNDRLYSDVGAAGRATQPCPQAGPVSEKSDVQFRHYREHIVERELATLQRYDLVVQNFIRNHGTQGQNFQNDVTTRGGENTTSMLPHEVELDFHVHPVTGDVTVTMVTEDPPSLLQDSEWESSDSDNNSACDSDRDRDTLPDLMTSDDESTDGSADATEMPLLMPASSVEWSDAEGHGSCPDFWGSDSGSDGEATRSGGAHAVGEATEPQPADAAPGTSVPQGNTIPAPSLVGTSAHQGNAVPALSLAGPSLLGVQPPHGVMPSTPTTPMMRPLWTHGMVASAPPLLPLGMSMSLPPPPYTAGMPPTLLPQPQGTGGTTGGMVHPYGGAHHHGPLFPTLPPAPPRGGHLFSAPFQQPPPSPMQQGWSPGVFGMQPDPSYAHPTTGLPWGSPAITSGSYTSNHSSVAKFRALEKTDEVLRYDPACKKDTRSGYARFTSDVMEYLRYVKTRMPSAPGVSDSDRAQFLIKGTTTGLQERLQRRLTRDLDGLTQFAACEALLLKQSTAVGSGGD